MIEQIRNELNMLSNEKVRDFSHKVTPTLSKDNILGVRVPDLRRLAKNIIKSDWRRFLNEASDSCVEELMLQGFVIATADMDVNERLCLVKDFIPKIDNWMVCDTFCNTLKPSKKSKDIYWDFIQPYLHHDKPYYIRFGVVMLLSHFASDEYADAAFDALNAIQNDDYYVKMAAAWAISVYFVHCRDKTEAFLKNNKLDDITYNKALQKIIESNRVDSVTKSEIRKMKRN